MTPEHLQQVHGANISVEALSYREVVVFVFVIQELQPPVIAFRKPA